MISDGAFGGVCVGCYGVRLGRGPSQCNYVRLLVTYLWVFRCLMMIFTPGGSAKGANGCFNPLLKGPSHTGSGDPHVGLWKGNWLAKADLFEFFIGPV